MQNRSDSKYSSSARRMHAHEAPANAKSRSSGSHSAPSRSHVSYSRRNREPEYIEEPEYRSVARKREHRTCSPIILFLLAVVAAGIFAWMTINLHPESTDAAETDSTLSFDLSGKLAVFGNNAKSDALSNITYIKKTYTIDESLLSAPKPDAAKFGSTKDPAEIADIIAAAADLIGDQTLAWDPDAELYPDSEIQYYLDDTLFVLCWKEIENDSVLSTGEVFMAHGSQLRRKISGDSYGSGVQQYASDMAKQANAVVAINGDFYSFRNLGITVYQRKLYRTGINDRVDSCFFTASGDMLMTHHGKFTSQEELEAFVTDNDVTFALSFGPILVEDGVQQNISSYVIGEIDTQYPRAAIGQLGHLHYLMLTVNIEGKYNGVADINRLAGYMYERGCQQAYTLDGGQTAVLLLNGTPVNRVSYGYERTMSDIIYFATAIPSKED